MSSSIIYMFTKYSLLQFYEIQKIDRQIKKNIVKYGLETSIKIERK